LPCNKSLCPGRTFNTWLSSGAPKKIDGKVSKKVCVTAIATIKTAIVNGLINCSKNGALLNRITLTRFTCMPGVIPEIIPKKIPRMVAINISNSII
jgi:hypothetical protein